jgi:hypothetical protein
MRALRVYVAKPLLPPDLEVVDAGRRIIWYQNEP